MTQAWMIQEQRILVKLIGVCGLSCLMYRCSPHRISWMLRGGSVFCQSDFHHKFTQFFTQSMSVISQQAHFGMVWLIHMFTKCLSSLAVKCQGPAVWYLGVLWCPSTSSSKSSSLQEKSKRSSEVVADNFFDKRALPLVWAILGRWGQR